MITESIFTARTEIRPFVEGDWPAVYAYTSLPAVMAYIPEGVFTEIDARSFVFKSIMDQAEAYAVILRDSGELIGHLAFHPWFAPRTYEIGWVFHPDYHGRGLATEAARRLLQFGFESLQLHRIIATCQPENPASFRVMEKLGMRREGHFRQCIYRGDNVWWDEYFYAMLAAEWPAASQN